MMSYILRNVQQILGLSCTSMFGPLRMGSSRKSIMHARIGGAYEIPELTLYLACLASYLMRSSV